MGVRKRALKREEKMPASGNKKRAQTLSLFQLVFQFFFFSSFLFTFSYLIRFPTDIMPRISLFFLRFLLGGM